MPASTGSHGPWQMVPITCDRSRTPSRVDGLRFDAQQVGSDNAARQHRRIAVGGLRLGERAIDRNRTAQFLSFQPLISSACGDTTSTWAPATAVS
ncbi:MAG: hypothetical protein M3Y43_09710, partial [Pseudomonadota bacterium]|nr:hypothetical protein [Pseudomonadota bacterium]